MVANVDGRDVDHGVGTWLENRYPGCACDIPSHAYTYQFALNANWPRFFSRSPDIWQYLDKVCNTFGLRKYMTFNTEVVGCYWEEEKGEWLVKLRETKPGQEPREFEDRCHLLLHGTGILNNFKVALTPNSEDDAVRAADIHRSGPTSPASKTSSRAA